MMSADPRRRLRFVSIVLSSYSLYLSQMFFQELVE
jgi:hypothetical protein